jgi:hypothetical protein
MVTSGALKGSNGGHILDVTGFRALGVACPCGNFGSRMVARGGLRPESDAGPLKQADPMHCEVEVLVMLEPATG